MINPGRREKRVTIQAGCPGENRFVGNFPGFLPEPAFKCIKIPIGNSMKMTYYSKRASMRPERRQSVQVELEKQHQT
jgi:hypothetical protein